MTFVENTAQYAALCRGNHVLYDSYCVMEIVSTYYGANVSISIV